MLTIDDLDTPALLIDLDVVDRNIARLQGYCDEHGLALRPHVKTHKIPALAHRQIAAGARGITCQKLGEAEVMAAAGLADILITYNILGPAKLERLTRLARQVQVRVAADAPEVVEGLASAAQDAGIALTVLVECDTGMGRAGVQTPEQALALAELIDGKECLRFGGLMTYPTLPSSGPWLQRACELLDRAQLAPLMVSGGGTVEAYASHLYPQITEVRAGNYIYNDLTTVARGGAEIEDCAQQVLATVSSRPTATRGILDAGSKALTSDPLRAGGATQAGHGRLLEYPNAAIYSLSEEHGVVDFGACPDTPNLGERVRVVANHCCTVTNLFDEVYAHRNGVIEAVWPIAARGKVR